MASQQDDTHNLEVKKDNESFASRMRRMKNNYQYSDTTSDGRQGEGVSDSSSDKDIITRELNVGYSNPYLKSASKINGTKRLPKGAGMGAKVSNVKKPTVKKQK